jgi:NADH-quinone oxidoreductase subunit K
MIGVPLEHIILIASILFACGLFGLLLRRNLIFIFLSIEVMLNAASLVFIAAGRFYAQPDAQVMFMLVLAVAAAEVAIALALAIKFEKYFKTLDARAANNMRG